MRIIGICSIILFSLGNIFIAGNKYYELWIILLYLILYSIYSVKDFYSKQNHKIQMKRIVDEEIYIYEREFKKYSITMEEYKNILMSGCTIRRSRNKYKLFATEGGPFDKVYFFAIIPKDVLVSLTTNKTQICYLRDGAWIGVVEFITQVFDDSQRKWMVGLELSNQTNEDIIWLEWNKDV
jgi:hypothetical protein